MEFAGTRIQSLCASPLCPPGDVAYSVWNGFVVQWELEPLVLGFLAMVKSPSSSWEVNFRKQLSQLSARDSVSWTKSL